MNTASKGALLPYVTEQDIPVAPKRSIFKPRTNQNGVATFAFIIALSSIILGILIIPSVLGIALGVGALIVAIKRKLSKKIPVISIIVSAITMTISTLFLFFCLFSVTPQPEPYVPLAYHYDTHSGIAYKYNPLSNIPCDGEGKCTFEVKLFAVDSSKCPKGGNFSPDMKDLTAKDKVTPSSTAFPALKNGETKTLNITLTASANSRLIEASSYPITCNK